METIEIDVGKKKLIIETGQLARQASGAAVLKIGGTMLLVTATAERRAQPPRGFVPLSVHYIEKMYAAGRIPGSFFRREGRLSDPEILVSRFIDRPVRPLLPKTWSSETQVLATVLSTDHVHEPAVAAITGASVALMISDIPFGGPIAGLRVAMFGKELEINPDPARLEEASLNFVVAGSKNAILMVEGLANEVSEADAIEAISLAHAEMQPISKEQEKLAKKVGKAKRAIPPAEVDEKLAKAVRKGMEKKIAQAFLIKEKVERYASLDELANEAIETHGKDDEEKKKQVGKIISEMKKEQLREMVIKTGKRVDGRSTKDIRPISSQVGFLPSSHGSAVFTRGETQALVAVTLGTKENEQLVDNLQGVSFKDFLFHYNFPPFSVGEASFLRGPGRREIGHGFLAEKAIKPVLPTQKDFPYTLRVVSEILESNGSSSMASVCGASLALMDAGVPIKAPVAGVAMGLIQENSKTVLLSDILGDEDHIGDMDFKVAGTSEGITALQMDNKVGGLGKRVLQTALKQAREGRLHILKCMEEALSAPREALSSLAPKMVAYKISREKIRDLIGPGGKVIRGIVEQTKAKVDVNDDGVVTIASSDHEAVSKALEMVKNLTQEVIIGSVYHGPVKKMMDFGAFVELIPGTDGLLHVSEMEGGVTRGVEEGAMLMVRVIGYDKRGKIKLGLSKEAS